MELDLTILFNLLKSTQDGVLNEYLDRYNGDEQLCLYHLEIYDKQIDPISLT